MSKHKSEKKMLSTWRICVFYSCVTGISGTDARQSWYDTITDRTSTSTNFKPVALTTAYNLDPASDDPASIRTNGPEWIRIMKRPDQGITLAMVREKHARGEMVGLKGHWSWYPAFFFRLV